MALRFRAGKGTVDLDARVVERNGKTFSLTSREVEVLRYFTARPNEVVTRDALLQDVWGFARPPNQTRAVDNVVRRIRQKIGDDPRRPKVLFTVHGEGYTLRAPVERHAGRTEGDRTFVGRSEEIHFLRTTLRGGATRLQVVGPSGAGKTRLLAAVASELEEVPWHRCDLLDVSTDGLPAAIAEALDLQLQAVRIEASHLDRSIRACGRRVLVMDNAEVRTADVSDLLRRWALSAPELVVCVATTKPLDVVGLTTLPLGTLADEAALELLRLLAGPAVEGWSREETLGLIHQVGGLPLAIELLSGVAPLGSSEMLSGQLARSMKLLTSTDDAPERHRALRATIAWTWEQLDPRARRALSDLSVCADSFDLELAEAVIDESWSQEALTRLIRMSLVHRRPTVGGQPRFTLLPSVRRFARHKLGDGVGGPAGRFATACAERARRWDAAVIGPQVRGALDALALELGNFRAAAKLATPEERVWILLALERWQHLRGSFQQRFELLDAAVDASERTLDPDLQARALVRRATCGLGTAGSHAEQDLELARSLTTDPDVAAEIAVRFAERFVMDGALDEAVRELDGALALAATSRPAALAHRIRGKLRAHRGADDAEVESEMEQALLIARRNGHRQLEAGICMDLGWFSRHRDRPLDAARWYQRSTAVAEEVQWRHHLVGMAYMRGGLFMMMGQHDAARREFLQALERAPLDGYWMLATFSLANLGALQLADGYFEEAEHSLNQALEWATEVRLDAYLVQVFLYRAIARAGLGYPVEARRDLERAELPDEHGALDSMRLCKRLAEAAVQVRFDHTARARAECEDALALARPHLDGDPDTRILAQVLGTWLAEPHGR